jgi:hypothetical protein
VEIKKLEGEIEILLGSGHAAKDEEINSNPEIAKLLQEQEKLKYRIGILKHV